MAQNTGNSRAFIESEQYSSFILRNLHDGMLPMAMYRNVTEFGSGENIHIKTVGTVTIQDGAEEVPFTYNPIESGEVFLQITDYVGDSWYVTDKLREDGAQVDALMQDRQSETLRAIQETFETRFLEECNRAQVDGDPNEINGFAHRIASTEADGKLQLSDLVKMKVAYDKAQVPMAGRMLMLDPVTAGTLDQLVNITTDVTPYAKAILDNGFDRDHEFLYNLYGWTIITSNRLEKGTFSDGTTTITDAVANVFMSVLDDQHKPMMAAWRRMPNVEGERNKDLRRDEFTTSSRWGIGPQRLDTLGIYITSAVNF